MSSFDSLRSDFSLERSRSALRKACKSTAAATSREPAKSMLSTVVARYTPGISTIDDAAGRFSNIEGFSKLIKLMAHAKRTNRSLSTLFEDQFNATSKYFGSKYLDDNVTINELIDSIEFVDSIPKIVDEFVSYASKESDETKEPEAPQDAPLGRYAFATSRKGVPFEIDTKKEARLYKSLIDYFNDNQPIAKNDVELMRTLLANGWYKDVFKRPSVDVVYRGMDVPDTWLRTALKINEKIDVPLEGNVEKRFTFVPRKNASSWSEDYEQAKVFSMPTNEHQEYMIILHARTDANEGSLLTCPGGLYDVPGFDLFSDEKEIVALGRIHVFKVEWRHVDVHFNET